MRRWWARLLLAGWLALGASCGGAPRGEAPESAGDTNAAEEIVDDEPEGRPSIREVMAAHRDAWMARPDVTGMGIGRCDGEPCIVVYLIRRTEDVEEAIPPRVSGYPVRLEVTGRVVPREPPDDADGGG